MYEICIGIQDEVRPKSLLNPCFFQQYAYGASVKVYYIESVSVICQEPRLRTRIHSKFA